MRFVGSLVTALVLVAGSMAAASPVHANQPAPALDLQQVLQAPDGSRATWQALRGRVVVLEFWATWCPTCVKSIPHFNALADELKDKPVEIISISDEAPAIVKSFLVHHPIHGWVGLNPTGSMFKSYGIDGRPVTFVIRPDGVVDAVICPYATPFPIGAQNLLNLLDGKPSGLVSSRVTYAGQVHDDAGRPIAGVSVRADGITSPDAWWRIGDAITDRNGRFTIDRQIPPSMVDQNPVRIEFVHPDYLYGRLEDLRILSPEEQTHLHVTLLEGNSITGTAVDSNGRPLANTTVQAVFGTGLSDQQTATTDANGAFVVRGLPSKPVELRVFARSVDSVLQTGRAVVDLTSSNRSATIRISPLVPSGTVVHDLLGMKVVEASGRVQARLALDHPSILVLDPGPHSEHLGMGRLHKGDCFWGLDGNLLVTDVAGFRQFVVRRWSAAEPGQPVRLSCVLRQWGGGVQIAGPWYALHLTPEELEELRTAIQHH